MARKKVVMAKIGLGYLLLDDDETLGKSVMKTIGKEIELACKSLGLDDILTVSISAEVKRDLESATRFVTSADSLPDWVFVDQRLDRENGRLLVESLSAMGYPADVLFYTAATEVPRLNRDIALRYGKVRSASSQTLSPLVNQMAKEFLIKWGDPEYVRGLVLSRAVDVDIAMDECIVKYFKIADGNKGHFAHYILGANGVRLGVKLDLLDKAKKSLEDKKKFQAYHQIERGKVQALFEKTRNVFAHKTLQRDPMNPFKIKLESKTGEIETMEKRQLDIYFLQCSRMISDLRRLENDLAETYA